MNSTLRLKGLEWEKKKLEMCPEDTDAPASEMLEVGNLLYTAQWKFLCPCHVNAYNCQLLLHMHWNFMKFGQNSANANPSLNAQLHTKTITVSKICEYLSSGIEGVHWQEFFLIYSLYGKVTMGHNLQLEWWEA